MKLQKIFFLLTLVLFSFTSVAQKTYYPFTYQNNDGLTDSLSTELVKPKYDYYRISKDKKLYVFHHDYPSELNSLIFNTQTGISDTNYRYVYFDDLIINEQSYHYFGNSKKSFLQNSQSDEIVKTIEDVYSFDNLGNRYIVGKFYAKDSDLPKSKSPGKNKNGLLLPPKLITVLSDFYVFYENKLPLKSVLKIDADWYLPLYSKNEIDDEYMKNIREYNSVDFDYLLFKKLDGFYLYDKNLKFIKKINYKNTKEDEYVDKDAAVDAASKVLGKSVYSSYKIYPSMGSSRNPDEEKKREAFEIKKSAEGFYQLIRTKDEKVCFTSPYKTIYNEDRSFTIEIEQQDKKSSYFFINKETGIPYLPAKYIDLLQIK